MKEHTETGSLNFRALLITILIAAALLAGSIKLVTIDFDLLSSLPSDNPIIADAKFVLTHHPFQDRVVIDLYSESGNLEQLTKSAKLVEEKLLNSGLFKEVGLKDTQKLFPIIIKHVTDNLPYLLSKEELEQDVMPRLEPEAINRQFESLITQLSGFEGIGQAEQMEKDPLGLRGIVLKKLMHLAPVQDVKLQDGFPISRDGKHLLLLATPSHSGTDTAFSRRIVDLLDSIKEQLASNAEFKNSPVKLTSVGSFRAALDNETIVKKDTQFALTIATVGIALLLLLSFPRPYMGLLSLVPAIFGTITAFFCCALLYDSISILALGFGGAIISITVDHSIAYLLFLDRRHKVYVKEAANEVKSIGLIAVLTTVGAFLVLSFSGFSILAQIGQFAALGIGFSFLFVHTVFPKIVTVMPPAKRTKAPLIQSLINSKAFSGKPVITLIVSVFGIVMIFFAKPSFVVDLNRMNTVSKDTLEAEELVSKTWGDINNQIFLLSESASLADLHKESDGLSAVLKRSEQKGLIQSAFTPSVLYPGETLANQNLAEWKMFWTKQRTEQFKKDLKSGAESFGFSSDAFADFIKSIEFPESYQGIMPDSLYSMLGVSRNKDKNNWILFTTLKAGINSDTHLLRQQIQGTGQRIFDPSLFSESFGEVLSSTFIKMLLIIGISITCLIFIFFLDVKLTLIALVPVVFALVSTLGTLKLLDHPLDIPGLMLSIIVLGMGVDYSLFFVRSYQRYGSESHPSLALVRTAVFLASASTLIGFGVMVSAEHSLLHSAGLVSLLGIGYSLIGANVLLPPLLRNMFVATVPSVSSVRGSTRYKRVLKRFGHIEAFPRMFARFKMIMDPMFGEIDQFLHNPSVIIDIGTGYGVPANWILDRFPKAMIHGLEPDAERVRVAQRVLGKRGTVEVGASPDLPKFDGEADTAVMLDMLHYLSDDDLLKAFENLRAKLVDGGRLIIRVTIPRFKKTPFFRKIESRQIEMRGGKHFYRQEAPILEALKACGFKEIKARQSGEDREETWITAVSVKPS